MALCKKEIICHIVRQLGANSECDTDLNDIVPALWDLVCFESGGDCTLQALLTKRESVLFLLGCASYSVDVSESHFVMNAESKADSKNDYHSQAQSTGSYNKFAVGTGGTRYDETSSAQIDGNSKRTGRTDNKTDGTSTYRDDGRGFGRNKSESFSAIDNVVNHQGESHTNSSTIGNGSRSDCNYEYSRNQTDGSAFYAIVFGASFTGSGSEWRKYSRTRASNLEQTNAASASISTERDTGLSTGRGTHRWESNFQADVEWSEQEYTINIHTERMDSRREGSALAAGDGDGIYEEKTKSNTASQGTALQTGRSDSTRTSTRTSSLSAFSISHSHRFQNLLNIYDQLTAQIEHLRKRMRSNSPPVIANLPCQCGSTCSCEARRIGLNAVQTYRPTTPCITGANCM